PRPWAPGRVKRGDTAAPVSSVSSSACRGGAESLRAFVAPADGDEMLAVGRRKNETRDCTASAPLRAIFQRRRHVTNAAYEEVKNDFIPRPASPAAPPCNASCANLAAAAG